MTIICFDGKVLAADTAEWFGDVICQYRNKIEHLSGSIYTAYTGSVRWGNRFKKWASQAFATGDLNEETEDYPEDDDSGNAIVVDIVRGKSWLFESGGPEVIDRPPPVALGAAHEAGYIAMRCGQTAIQAVETCIKWASGAAGAVTHIEIQPPTARPENQPVAPEPVEYRAVAPFSFDSVPLRGAVPEPWDSRDPLTINKEKFLATEHRNWCTTMAGGDCSCADSYKPSSPVERDPEIQKDADALLAPFPMDFTPDEKAGSAAGWLPERLKDGNPPGVKLLTRDEMLDIYLPPPEPKPTRAIEQFKFEKLPPAGKPALTPQQKAANFFLNLRDRYQSAANFDIKMAQSISGASEPTTKKYLDALVAAGIIKVIRQGTRAGGVSTLWEIPAPRDPSPEEEDG